MGWWDISPSRIVCDHDQKYPWWMGICLSLWNPRWCSLVSLLTWILPSQFLDSHNMVIPGFVRIQPSKDSIVVCLQWSEGLRVVSNRMYEVTGWTWQHCFLLQLSQPSVNYGFRDNPSAELGLQFQFVMHELLQEHDKASSFIDLGPLPFDPAADALKWPLKCAWRKRTMDGAAFKNLMTCQKSLFNPRYDSKQDVFKTVSLNKIFNMHCLKTSSFMGRFRRQGLNQDWRRPKSD